MHTTLKSFMVARYCWFATRGGECDQGKFSYMQKASFMILEGIF